jgi:anti-sigma factor RsiW
MADTQLRRLMQKKLDGELELEQMRVLERQLKLDQEAAEEYALLEEVETVLAQPPMIRAPQRLAVTIMARLAAQMERQAQLEELPQAIQEAYQVSLSTISTAMLPMMMVASYMVMNAQAKPELIVRVAERTIALQVMMLKSLIFLLEEVELQIQQHPEKAQVAFSLIPAIMLGMLDTMLKNGADEN